MTNNGEKMDKTIKRINEILAERAEKFAERDNVKGTLDEKIQAIDAINTEIMALNSELSGIIRELKDNEVELKYRFNKVTSNKENKGKKILVRYQKNGEELKAHIVEANRGKFNAVIDEINANDRLLAYCEENVTIDEKGIVSDFAIDEDAVGKMTDEEKMEYFNNLCIKIADPDKIVGKVAKRIITDTRYVIVNSWDEKIYLECLSRYKESLLAVESKKNDHIRMTAVQAILRQPIKVSPVEVSEFKIDWNYVKTIESLEERAEYFNDLAKKIAASPKDNPKKIALGKNSCAVVNSCDEYIFLQCFNEYSKAKREIKRRSNPSYTIDWDYVNQLDSANQKADYFENLCGKIDAVEKFDTVDITSHNHVFTVNKVDKVVFETAMANFEKYYLEALKEEKEKARLAEEERLAKIEEEKRRQEELEQQRIEEEKRKQEELEQQRIEEEKRRQEELEQQRIEEEKRRQEELEQQRIEEEKRKREELEKITELANQAKIIDAAKKAADALNEKNRMEAFEAKILAEANKASDELSTREASLALNEDDKEEFMFLGEAIRGGGADNQASLVIPEVSSVLEELEGFNGEESLVDFFDEDEEEFIEEETLEDENPQAPSEEQDQQEKVEYTEKNDEFYTAIDGLEILDLSADEKKEEASDAVFMENVQKKSLKDRILGKFGKHDKNDKNDKNNGGSAGGQISANATETGESIEILENEALKVLSSREYSDNVSNSKLYTVRKNLYLTIMDWIADQQIHEKVQIVTKRQAIEVDAKYADMYKFFVNKYEALEDKYERYAADKYHNLKVKTAICAPVALASLVLIAYLGLDAYNSRVVQADGINTLNNEIGIESSIQENLIPKDMTKIDELIDDSASEYQNIIEDEGTEEIIDEESRVNTPSYGEAYPYAGVNAPEAFNVSGSQYYSDEDVTDEIRNAAEANKKPILELLR